MSRLAVVADGAMGQVACPEEHAFLLHGGEHARGLVTVARVMDQGWRETRHRPERLPLDVRGLAGVADAYVSQNRFGGPRRVARLAQLNALFSDLDYYRIPHLRTRDPRWVLTLALEAADEEVIPPPSLAVFTGRGLCLVWRHTPVPKAALPRWTACQHRLYDVFAEFGADAAARDAARVLRLIGTRNSKSAGVVVQAVMPAGQVWPFDLLADEILPVRRIDLARSELKSPLRDLERIGNALGAASAALWASRIRDLERLAELRYGERPKLPPGHRDEFLFTVAVGLSWLVPADRLQAEVFEYARRFSDWGDSEARACAFSVVQRAQASARGERVEWNGQSRDPRYRIRTSTIIERLEITADEQQQLNTLVGKDIVSTRRAEAERLRWHRRREAAARLSREEYLGRAEAKRQAAQLLRTEGATYREIAEQVGVPIGTVSSLLTANAPTEMG
jgi:DNA-directed RNA polymerase specialized sigma24 family protein